MKETTRIFLDKAVGSIKAAKKMSEPDEADSAASRAYYAMFHAAEALLNEKELSFKRHMGVHNAFAEHFVKTKIFDQKFHRWLIEAFNSRLTSDYGSGPSISIQEVQVLIQQAREFLEATKQYLSIEK